MGEEVTADPGLRRRLEEARKAKGLTKRGLERAAGLGDGYYSKLSKGTRGKRISAEVLTRIATALGVRERWLSRGELPREEQGNPDTPARRAEKRALSHHLPAEAIASVLASPDAETADEETLFRLMALAGYRILGNSTTPPPPRSSYRSKA